MLGTRTISFNCDLKNLQFVRNFVRTELTQHALSAVVRNQIVLAIDEICSNLIIHSNKSDALKTIELKLSIVPSPKGITIELKENGTPFNYNNYIEPNLEELKTRRVSGQLGLMLVRRIMDKIEYFQVENHNVCRLYKSLG